MSSLSFDIAVIGGGAAGLFCALTAGRLGQRVVVLESADRVGKKILMSGGGRCNFTNRVVTPAQYLGANPHFCKSALARFAPEPFIALVDAHRIAWHEKELGQLFCDDSAKQIVRMLLDECAAAGVEIRCRWPVSAVRASAQGGGPRDEPGFAVSGPAGVLHARRVVVASGGLSVPTLGGSDIGYRIARDFGHAIRPTRAGLVPLTLSGRPLEHWQDLAGLSLPVEVEANGQRFRNALLLTHRGLSGPAILQISSYWQPTDPLAIRLLPDALPEGDWTQWLTAQKHERPAAELKNVLADVLPRRFAHRFAELHLPPRLMRQLTHAELAQCAQALTHWPIVASGTEGYRTAEVTLGGVDTDGISSSSFESRRQPGLYFIGEVLDVTGWLGGYNFHWAWASAHACAHACAKAWASASMLSSAHASESHAPE